MESGPVTIFQTLNIAEAQLVSSRLQAAGFFASVSHELAALSMEGYSLSAGGVRVEVPAEQAEEARAFLEAPDAEPPASGSTAPDSPA